MNLCICEFRVVRGIDTPYKMWRAQFMWKKHEKNEHESLREKSKSSTYVCGTIPLRLLNFSAPSPLTLSTDTAVDFVFYFNWNRTT